MADPDISPDCMPEVKWLCRVLQLQGLEFLHNVSLQASGGEAGEKWLRKIFVRKNETFGKGRKSRSQTWIPYIQNFPRDLSEVACVPLIGRETYHTISPILSNPFSSWDYILIHTPRGASSPPPTQVMHWCMLRTAHCSSLLQGGTYQDYGKRLVGYSTSLH